METSNSWKTLKHTIKWKKMVSWRALSNSSARSKTLARWTSKKSASSRPRWIILVNHSNKEKKKLPKWESNLRNKKIQTRLSWPGWTTSRECCLRITKLSSHLRVKYATWSTRRRSRKMKIAWHKSWPILKNSKRNKLNKRKKRETLSRLDKKLIRSKTSTWLKK